MLVTGAPQQGLPGKKLGYRIAEDEDGKTFIIMLARPEGLDAARLASPAPGAAGDPIRQRGIKVIHVGFLKNAIGNRGRWGTVRVRFRDAKGGVVIHGSYASLSFRETATAQILPTNLPDAQRNHNWRRVPPGAVVGESTGTVSLAVMLYAKAPMARGAEMAGFKQGILGAGVLSPREPRAAGYAVPGAYRRYNGGLILRDGNGDGRLDPAIDAIIGGIIGGIIASAPFIRNRQAGSTRGSANDSAALRPRHEGKRVLTTASFSRRR